MEDIARQAVAAFAEIELEQRAASAGLVIDKVQRMDGLIDAADFGDGLRQAGRTLIEPARCA
ncbi:MAG: hypothetical protein CBARDCOR_2097 [uncultured Caballeronia sp.]|nr:MAG: hypothetical protein CBARDCOR_2097 [uncultured Caballeronia sp.]